MKPLERKDLYSEIGLNYRYFLNWRERLLAGYFFIIVGLITGFSWMHFNDFKKFSFIPFLLGSFFSFFFRQLDCKVRHLYHACLDTGSGLEEGKGIYSALNETKESKTGGLSHSAVLDIMFFLGMGIFLIISITIFLTSYCGLFSNPH